MRVTLVMVFWIYSVPQALADGSEGRTESHPPANSSRQLFTIVLKDNSTITVPEHFVQSQGSYSLSNNIKLTENLLNSNPYLHGQCPMASITTANEMKFCILKNKWLDRGVVDTMHNWRRVMYFGVNFDNIPMSVKKHGDCFFGRRRARQVPTNCYGAYKSEASSIFLREVMNDIRYTFDYVLYSGYNCTLENSLWYLILFLKQLVIKLPDPSYLIQMVTDNNKSFQSKMDRHQQNIFKYEGLANISSTIQTKHAVSLSETLFNSLFNTKKGSPKFKRNPSTIAKRTAERWRKLKSKFEKEKPFTDSDRMESKYTYIYDKVYPSTTTPSPFKGIGTRYLQQRWEALKKKVFLVESAKGEAFERRDRNREPRVYAVNPPKITFHYNNSKGYKKLMVTSDRSRASKI